MTTVEVGLNKQPFTIHADLLCRDSAYFRDLLQPNRRPVEGECSICHEDLLPHVEELTHCHASCGGNFHYICMVDWMQEAAPQEATCPLCRHAYKDPMYASHHLDNIDDRSFEMYVEWLYTGQILVAPTSADESTSPTLAIIHAYEDRKSVV